jgi:type IV pilus assembly protein PilV
MLTPALSRRRRGFSLIEVLVALLVFSLGLLGVAALLMVSVRTNHSAYQRTQATHLAESIANRMRANSRAVWNGDYAGSYPRAGNTGACTPAAPCGFQGQAQRDVANWSTELTNFLPNVQASIACVRSSTLTPPDLSLRPPYDGLCTLTMTWTESAVVRTTTPAPAQRFVWMFQP